MSPTAATTLLGEYAKVPLAFPTVTTWTMTPLAAVSGISDMFFDFKHLHSGLTKGAADAQEREGESSELHVEDLGYVCLKKDSKVEVVIVSAKVE